MLTARPHSERFGERKPPPVTAEPPRGTVYLDLRKSEEALEQERQRQAVVQRVLKLNE